MDAIPGLSPAAASIPWLTTQQMVEVDRAMTEDYGIVLMQMMEHAGRHLAYLARARFLAGDAARPLVGELYLADIGVPPQLYGRPPLALDVPNIFAAADLVRIW